MVMALALNAAPRRRRWSLAMGLYFTGMGMVLPQAQAGALLPFPERAGAASSLLGFVQQMLAAIGRRAARSHARHDGLAARGSVVP